MPSDRDRQAWTDILDNARLALGFAGEMDEAAFAADVRTFYAVTRCLEIISEAARRLSEGERARNPDLPWKDITGAGNVYRHNYDDVEVGLVWITVRDRLRPLIIVAEGALAVP
jgi:uncharacterized protein with HEPN domain